MTEPSFWKRCSTCKKEIGFARPYWVCNVSTCNRGGTIFAFCSVSCWDGHLPVMHHRDAWAIEEMAPGAAAPAAEASSQPTSKPPASPRVEIPRDVLVVVSKLKGYIRLKSGMSTADEVIELLSDELRTSCDQAIDHARRSGRRTVMARDFRP